MSDIKQLTNEAKQYLELKKQIKFLEERQKEIKERLNQAVQELGETDGLDQDRCWRLAHDCTGTEPRCGIESPGTCRVESGCCSQQRE